MAAFSSLDLAALQSSVERSLASHNYANAVFLAERLHAAEKTDDTAFVLGTAYYRAGQVKQAYRVLHERPSTPDCAASRFLLARCCVEVEEMVEAETLLLKAVDGGGAAAGSESLELLGVVYRQTRRKDLAITTFKRALALDPTLWTAYESLCELAAGVDAAEAFEDGGGDEMSMGQGTPNPSMALNFSGFGTTPKSVGRGGGAEGGGVGAAGLMSLLRELGAAYQALCLYDCATTIQRLDALLPSQRNTGWVLAQLGRAHFEKADYASADKCFKQMRSVDPGRIDGLEIYSTTLWHLRKEVELCFLAQQAMELDRTAWQCCCVVGNCFALQKEHEQALKFFGRAMQTSPAEPYAHTLAGHEHLANEEFDRAVDFYRAAIRADERHYNAWYGLGYVYYRQEKYDLAEYHFKRAIQINERSTGASHLIDRYVSCSFNCVVAVVVLGTFLTCGHGSQCCGVSWASCWRRKRPTIRTVRSVTRRRSST